MLGKFVIPVVVGLLILGGCGGQRRVLKRDCLGKSNAAEAIVGIRARSQKDFSIKANGKCIVEFHIEGKKHKESFPVKLWLDQPSRMRLQGDIAFDPKGLIVGANEQEFWISSKLGEDGSSYYWGKWSQAGDFEKLRISPRLVLEAFGIVDIGDEQNWLLSADDGFDVLTEEAGDGVVKKIYIDRCDYLIMKIEYVNSAGEIMAVTELSKYRKLGEDLSLPSVVEITTYPDSVGDVLKIKLDSVKEKAFSEAQRQRLFGRPKPGKFENVYEIIDGRIIEQKTENPK